MAGQKFGPKEDSEDVISTNASMCSPRQALEECVRNDRYVLLGRKAPEYRIKPKVKGIGAPPKPGSVKNLASLRKALEGAPGVIKQKEGRQK